MIHKYEEKKAEAEAKDEKSVRQSLTYTPRNTMQPIQSMQPMLYHAIAYNNPQPLLSLQMPYHP